MPCSRKSGGLSVYGIFEGPKDLVVEHSEGGVVAVSHVNVMGVMHARYVVDGAVERVSRRKLRPDMVQCIELREDQSRDRSREGIDWSPFDRADDGLSFPFFVVRWGPVAETFEQFRKIVTNHVRIVIISAASDADKRV